MTDRSPERDAAAEDRHTGGARVGHGDAEWDERYASTEQVWSGRPNGALVSEVTELQPGRALDVGCGEGEGADAVWLARRGWEVAALDVSRVALERAALRAREAGVPTKNDHENRSAVDPG